MYVLGLESSCDETSAAVLSMDEASGVRDIKSNIVASQIDIHAQYGGVVPEIASRAHIESVTQVTKKALDTAGITARDLGCVAVTSHPGMIGALLVGVNFGKSLAFANQIPLVGVDHIKAHVAAAYLTDPGLKPPFLALVVSGGHTSFYLVSDFTKFEEIGSTRDDAIGEAFDKIARVMGMPYPGGAALDRIAYEGRPGAFSFPSPALAGDNLDFSFSGIKTAALNIINGYAQREEELPVADIARGYLDAIVTAVIKKIRLALNQTGANAFIMAGGVAANSHLREAVLKLCKNKKVSCHIPSPGLCGDNGAMVAAAGYYDFLTGARAGTDLNASASDDLG
ncbi:MAG: tRNA (adenosine(37)-N6)-threonylcarbamoyltransferase complex transferase subunit TsaD [Clostridia bacterium]|nr:tRNA (adenosine(37)-N6)-threonylcarbamoyltransferase complex transferase subunit TsaD [Clostridia bacterium]